MCPSHNYNQVIANKASHLLLIMSLDYVKLIAYLGQCVYLEYKDPS